MTEQNERDEPDTVDEVPQFEVWRTIKVGSAFTKTPDDFRRQLGGTGVTMTADSFALMDGTYNPVTIMDPSVEVDLVVVAFDDLDFDDGTASADFCERALEFGLEICPVRIALEAFLQNNETAYKWTGVGSRPLIDEKDQREYMLELEELADGRKFLTCIPADDHFNAAIFIRPRNQLFGYDAKV